MQFDRVAYVDVGQAGAEGQARRMEGLRIEFEIEKSVKPSANTAVVRVYNLAQPSRAAVLQKGQTMVVFAGYAGEGGAQQIFRGGLDLSHSRHLPPEWVTELRVGDGRKQMREGRLELGLAPGCKVGDACKVVAQRVQLPIKNAEALDETDEEFAGGFSFAGPAEEALREITAAGDLEFSIQDENIQFTKRGQPVRGEATKLSPDSGLISTPEPVLKHEAKLLGKAPKIQWKARCLLNPLLTPGGSVSIQSQAVNGDFRIEALRHVGDTHGEEWFTELELARYG